MTQVTPPLPASPHTVAAYLAVLRAAQKHRWTITRVKVAKLLYLSDLTAVAAGEEPVSGIEWRWLQHGPYNNDLMFLENALVTGQFVSREQYYYGWSLTLKAEPNLAFDLPARCADRIYQTVAGLGSLAANSLKDMSYQTAPMLAAQKHGERGVILDLELARPTPKLSRFAARMRDVLAGLPEQETQPGAGEDLERDVRASAVTRGRANATLLGDE